jgi:hypothetical protein
MSYDIELQRNGETLELLSAHHLTGGTYALGGTNLATLNVTWNYGKFFYQALGSQGISAIYGKPVMVGLQMLAEAITHLHTEYGAEAQVVDDDYWAPTVGNAVKALSDLIYLGTISYAEYPDAVWNGD